MDPYPVPKEPSSLGCWVDFSAAKARREGSRGEEGWAGGRGWVDEGWAGGCCWVDEEEGRKKGGWVQEGLDKGLGMWKWMWWVPGAGGLVVGGWGRWMWKWWWGGSEVSLEVGGGGGPSGTSGTSPMVGVW